MFLKIVEGGARISFLDNQGNVWLAWKRVRDGVLWVHCPLTGGVAIAHVGVIELDLDHARWCGAYRAVGTEVEVEREAA